MAFDTKTTLSCISFYYSNVNQTGFVEPSLTVDIWHSNICPSDVCPGDNYKLADFTLQTQRLIQVIFRGNFKHGFNTTKLSSTQLGTTQPQLVFLFYCSY